MRKSLAPSRSKADSDCVTPTLMTRINVSTSFNSGIARTSKSILDLLSESSGEETISFEYADRFKSENTSQDHIKNDDCQDQSKKTERIYEVVIGKPSTKKHKTWDGDGILVVNLEKNTAVLKDSSNKVLGQTSKFSLDSIEDGKYLHIGGKVVDVIGLMSEPNKTTPNSSAESKKILKRSLTPGTNSNHPRKFIKVQRKQNFCDQANSKTVLHSRAPSSEPSVVSSNVRSNEAILRLISGSPDDENNSTFSDSENLNFTNIPGPGGESTSNQAATFAGKGVRTYEVVYGKPSTKKHKTWDGDGILEIDLDGRTATLKDEKGKIIGQKRNFKLECLEESEHLEIGGKVVDVLNIITNVCPSAKKSPEKSPSILSNIKKSKSRNIHTPAESLQNTGSSPSAFIEHEVRKPGTVFSSSDLKKCFKNEPNLIRSSEEILGLLSEPVNINDSSYNFSVSPGCEKKGAENSSVSLNLPRNISVDLQSQQSNTRTFHVMFGKQSTRKQKVWEDDGLLEVNMDSYVAVLKTTNGKALGEVKIDSVEPGSRLVIGTKEVEILNETVEKSKCGDPMESSEVAKNQKNKPMEKKKSILWCNRGKTSLLMQNVKPLNLPKPGYQHQWMYNKNHLPVADVTVDPFLLKVLREHQREGVLFLYKCVTGLRDENFFGAILADEMGLGKTLQSITLIWTLLKQNLYGCSPLCSRVLIVTPSSLVVNWKKEFQRWLGSHRLNVFVVDQKNKPRDYCKLPAAKYPVLIISYEMYVKCAEDLSEIKFDLLICDEGHRLKNTNIKVAICLNQLECRRRILLTGTPIQNDLLEFYALVSFVNPGILGSAFGFKKYYVDPISISHQPNVDEDIQQLGKERAAELNKLTGDFILRRTQDINDKYLPNKHELIIFCSSTQLQQDLYTATVSYWEERNIIIPGSDSGIKHLSVITALKKICNHPFLLKLNESSADFYEQEESLKHFLSNMLPNTAHSSNMQVGQISSKFAIVDGLLKELRSRSREKIVLVSYFTRTLDLLANLCNENQYKFLRLDGATPAAQRIPIVDKFNSSPDYYVFLLSAKAGGVGLNLVGASRLVLFDSDWNPATDLQAMSRIWRDGQKRSVYIYRLFTSGTVEEKILQRQISKTGISSAVVDPKNNSNVCLSMEELKDLFRFEPEITSSTHDMLGCECDGSGLIPDEELILPEEEESPVLSDRECQVSLDDDSSVPSNVLRLNQLLSWEHHKKPIDESFLQALCLSSAVQSITFIFHNKVTTEVGSQ